MTDLKKLRGFAQAVMEAWPDGDVDGSDLQDFAITWGLLEPVKVDAPCEENCFCAEYYHLDEFPVTCYRRTKLLEGK